MNPRSIPWIRLAYLLPLILGVLFLVVACLPHFFFSYQLESTPELSRDMSLFDLLDNAFATCSPFLGSDAKGAPSDLYFAYTILAFWVLFWISVILYAVFAVFTALLGVLMWTPTTEGSKPLNTTKRVYRILVPNRVFYVIFCLLPLLPACFPYIVQLFYRSILSLEASVTYYVMPMPIPVLLLCALSVISFLLTKRAQRDWKMDAFRLYKTKA